LIGETEQGRIHLDPPNQELVAKLDLRLIRIALLNLLGNALKSSPPDRQVGIRIESATGADGVAGCAWVIEDQGPGIPDSLRGELFRKLSGEDWKREGSGLGLGCYLVAMVAERHHGTVSVENLPAGGARFVLWIPLLPRVEENPQAAPS
jgi:signal transduction histidine kinase